MSKISFSRILAKGQTVIPSDVRIALGIKPGDVLRYQITSVGVVIDKALSTKALSTKALSTKALSIKSDDLLAEFTEWASKADKKAFFHF